MRVFNLDCMKIVHCGEEWNHRLPPSSKEMMRVLEKNERIVSWVQPVDGTVDDQIPVWRIGTCYYKMSLRMMKSIFRHVRLRKGFINREMATFGGEKLRIPRVLLMEKMRTQHRFNAMRMDPLRSQERKQPHCASHKIFQVIEDILLPLKDRVLPPSISFKRIDGDNGDCLLQKLRDYAPQSLSDRDNFMSFMGAFFDEYVGPETPLELPDQPEPTPSQPEPSPRESTDIPENFIAGSCQNLPQSPEFLQSSA